MESVSVIIPTYNRANTLANCISSVLNQTYEVNEILVCDDGSTDNSKQIVESFNSQKVKWINCGRNGRPAIPRNMGIETATSDWVAFLDSDDQWLPEKIEFQMQRALELNAGALCSNASVISRSGDVKPYHTFTSNLNFEFKDLLQRNEVVCSSVLLKREVLTRSGLFNVDVNFTAVEDYDLWLKVSTLTPFVYLKDELVLYMDDPESSIRSHEKNINEKMYVVFNDILFWVKKSGISISKSDMDQLKRKALHFYYYNDKSILHYKYYLKRFFI